MCSCLKIIYFYALRLLQLFRTFMIQAKKITAFQKSTGYNTLLKRKRYRSCLAKNKMKKYVQCLLSVIILIIVFATSKDPSNFNNTLDIEIGLIIAVVGNYSTATVLNNKNLFVRKLVPTSEYSLVTISGEDHKLSHYGLIAITICNDEGIIDTI